MYCVYNIYQIINHSLKLLRGYLGTMAPVREWDIIVSIIIMHMVHVLSPSIA